MDLYFQEKSGFKALDDVTGNQLCSVSISDNKCDVTPMTATVIFLVVPGVHRTLDYTS